MCIRDSNQNPVLKKAGVVDAGGMGFVVILEGMLSSLCLLYTSRCV